MAASEVRTQIYLPRRLHGAVKRAARSRGVSMAQFLRDAAESALRRTEPAARGPFDDLIGVIRDAPSDLAEHHDRYLYGARSKRR